MSIRIVNCGGNSALRIVPSYDECIIESNVENDTSFVMDIRDGAPIYKRIRSYEDVGNFIAEMLNNDEIFTIVKDEENHGIVITLRQLGQEPIDVGEVSEVS